MRAAGILKGDNMERPIQATIEAKRKFAEVDFDMFSRGRQLTEEGTERLEKVFHDYARTMRRAGLAKGLRLSLGLSSGRYKVLKDDAEAIQKQVEAVLNDPECTQLKESVKGMLPHIAKQRRGRGQEPGC